MITPTTDTDFLPINGTDYIEFYVGNAKQAAYYYRSAFGYQLLAYAGPETGVRDRASYVLQQGKIRLVLTTPMHPDSPITEHIAKHGDGVKVLALWVDDATKAWQETTARGARSAQEPTVLTDQHGKARWPSCTSRCRQRCRSWHPLRRSLLLRRACRCRTGPRCIALLNSENAAPSATSQSPSSSCLR